MGDQPEEIDNTSQYIGLVFDLIWMGAFIASIVFIFLNRFYMCIGVNFTILGLFFSIYFKKSIPSKVGPVDVRNNPILYNGTLFVLAVIFIIAFIILIFYPAIGPE
jgi:hypothetical protein